MSQPPQQYNISNIVFSSMYNPQAFEVFNVDRSNSHQLQSHGINSQELNSVLIELNRILNNYYDTIKKNSRTLMMMWLITFLLFLPTLGLILFIMMPILIILQFKYGQENSEMYSNETVPALRRIIDNENLKYNQLGLNISLNFDTDYSVVTNYRRTRVHRPGHHVRYQTKPVTRTIANRYVQLTITSNNIVNGNMNNNVGNSNNGYSENVYQQYNEYGTNTPQQQTNSHYYQKI